jgi:hypothetical protein
MTMGVNEALVRRFYEELWNDCWVVGDTDAFWRAVRRD